MNNVSTSSQWTPQSPFLQFYNTATFPPSAPLQYVASDTQADWADQGGSNGHFFKRSIHFMVSKLKSFAERLSRMNFITACL